MSVEDEPSWGGKVGTGKQDSRPWCPTPPHKEDLEFELTEENKKIKEDLEKKIGPIEIIPSKGLAQFFHKLYNEITKTGEVRLSPELDFKFILQYDVKPKMTDNFEKQITTYIIDYEVNQGYLLKLKNKLQIESV